MIYLIAIICGLIGTYSGSRNTELWPRRYLIPFIITVFAVLEHGWLGVLTMTMVGVFSLGYGESSALYEWWEQVCQLKDKGTKVLVRATVGFLFGISLIWAGVTLLWLVCTLLAMLTYVLFGVIIENEPVVETKEFTFLIEDLCIYSILTFLALKIIYA